MRFGKAAALSGVAILALGTAIIVFNVVTDAAQSTPAPGSSSTGRRPSTPPAEATSTGALSFAVTGSCTTSGGTLTARAAGFTVGGTYRTVAWYPDGRTYPLASSTAPVTDGGGVSWTWPCAGDPPGEYTTELVDEPTGRTTGRVRFSVDRANEAERPPIGPTAAPVPTRTVPTVAAGHVAQSANRNGAPLFADTNGAAADADPDRIPYGREVAVTCKVRNTSAITSVSYWYRLASSPWIGLYAPSDVFANGDPLGSTGTTNVDPTVPDC